jgi:two-component system, NtrC family, response regulator AtoC
MTAKPRLTVLVVDDEALLRWSIAELLRRGGHAVIEATSAAEARDAMNRTPDRIDVVLLDYRLPDGNDLRLLDEVRHSLPQSAVLLMTAFGTPEMVQGATDRGAYCVLSKPFDMHDIEALVIDAHRTSRYHGSG